MEEHESILGTIQATQSPGPAARMLALNQLEAGGREIFKAGFKRCFKCPVIQEMT